MKRKPAMAIAATAAMIGAAGIVTVASLTGANVFGFHFGSRAVVTASAPEPSTTEATVDDTRATDPPTTDTLPPMVVVQTEYVDQFVTVTAAPAPAPAAYQAPADDSPPPAAPATLAPATTEPATTPTTPATTEAPVTDPPTTEAATTTTRATVPVTTTIFDRTKYPFKVNIPTDWGSKPIPALPTPAAGKQWQECELMTAGYWACQYP